MLNSTILEVAIGVMFLYLLLSLICSFINESISSIINQRGKNLFEGIRNLLNDPAFTGLAQQLYSHGLVEGISRDSADPKKPNRPPSYIPSATFALSLLDILGVHGIAADAPAQAAEINARQAALDAAVKSRDADPTNAALVAAVQAAQAALDQAKTALQQPVTVGEKLQAATAAAAQVKSWQDVSNLETASKALEAALAAGRELAAAHPDPLGNLRKGIDSLPPGHTKESLLVLVDKTRREVALVEGDIDRAVLAVERLQKNVEQWFNDAMDRVSGWYKRWTQVLLVVLALVAVSVTNADTIALSKRLARDSALRASLVAAASDIVKSAPSPSGAAAAPGAATPAPAPTPTPLPPDLRDKVFAQAQQINLPLGWATTPVDPYAAEQVPGDIGGWLLKMCGLLISAAMVSLGAPFWFDTLSRFVNLRGAGTPPGESKKGALADTKR